MLNNKTKKFVLERSNGICEYCKSPANISSQSFIIEHIIPISKGGTSTLENLALSCQGCNNFKYNKTDGIDNVTGKSYELYNPRKHKWFEHFSWSSDVTEIIGISAIGRVAVNLLKLNRIELQNLRKLLSTVGKHPPLN